jgi:hypothetical protein
MPHFENLPHFMENLESAVERMVLRRDEPVEGRGREVLARHSKRA